MKVFQVTSEYMDESDNKIIEQVQYVTHKDDSILAVTEYFTKECEQLEHSLMGVAEVLTIVQQLLGHAKLGSTERYLHTSEADLRETIHNMPIYDVIRCKKKYSKTKFRRLYAKSTGKF